MGCLCFVKAINVYSDLDAFDVVVLIYVQYFALIYDEFMTLDTRISKKRCSKTIKLDNNH